MSEKKEKITEVEDKKLTEDELDKVSGGTQTLDVEISEVTDVPVTQHIFGATVESSITTVYPTHKYNK